MNIKNFLSNKLKIKYFEFEYSKINYISSEPYFELVIQDALGGEDAKEWIDILKKEYTKYFDIKKIPIEKYEILKEEIGKHKFIRTRKNKRQTSFLNVYFEIKQNFDINIDSNDIVSKFTTGSGPGGQNRDKSHSKSVIVYEPLNIIVREETTRSSEKNYQENIKKLKEIIKEKIKTFYSDNKITSDKIVRIYELKNKLFILNNKNEEIFLFFKNKFS